MSDLMATVERLREAQELERLRAENAALRRENHALTSTVFNQRQEITSLRMQSSAPMFGPWSLQGQRSGLDYAGMLNAYQSHPAPSPFSGVFGGFLP